MWAEEASSRGSRNCGNGHSASISCALEEYPEPFRTRFRSLGSGSGTFRGGFPVSRTASGDCSTRCPDRPRRGRNVPGALTGRRARIGEKPGLASGAREPQPDRSALPSRPRYCKAESSGSAVHEGKSGFLRPCRDYQSDLAKRSLGQKGCGSPNLGNFARRGRIRALKVARWPAIAIRCWTPE